MSISEFDECPILDIGTHTEQSPGKRLLVSADYPLTAYVRASCGRAVIQARLASSGSGFSGVDPVTGEVFSSCSFRSSFARSSDRRRTVIRDFALHNRLAYLLTLTFSDEHLPFSVEGCFQVFKLFMKRLRYQVGSEFPYVAVVERGSKGGRLHLHVAVGRWYLENLFVSVCSSCARPGVRVSPASEGRPCLACIWGNGFVSGPGDKWAGEVRANGDPNRAAAYLSKYVSKDFSSSASAGRNAYRVSRGFQPSVVRVSGIDFDSLLARVSSVISAGTLEGVEVFSLHERIEDFVGFPTWLVSAPLPLLPSVC